MEPSDLNPEQACELLRAAGFAVSPATLTLERRDDRWLACWPPGNELAWFAAGADATSTLRRERLVLALVGKHCSFQAPELRFASADDSLQVRSRIQGLVDPAHVSAELRRDPAKARTVGRWLGQALAELHTRIPASAVESWLPARPAWPLPTPWILEHLPGVIGAGHPLLSGIAALLEQHDAHALEPGARVLAHTDLGFHNIVFTDAMLEPCGIIDFETAAYVDRHYDFRYLLLDDTDTTLLDSACAAYEEGCGIRPDRRRILIFNAASACSYLAHRTGVAPDMVWCGRTLAEDLAWTTHALRRAAA